jgi:hypothetical protein
MIRTFRMMVVASGLALIFGIVFAQSTPETSVLNSNVVIEMKGDAEIHRSNWVDPLLYVPLALGDFLGNADIVDPADGSEVTVLCGSGQIVMIADSSKSLDECGPREGPFDPSTIMRSPPPNTVILITPRGYIMSQRPHIQWIGIVSARQYTIRITKPSTADPVFERTIASDTHFDYPDDVTALDPGEYSITVEPLDANNGVIVTGRTSEGIIVIDPELSTRLNAAFSQHDLQTTQADMAKYVNSLFLADNKLYWDAIQELEQVLHVNAVSGQMLNPKLMPDARSLRGSPFPYLILGQWYADLGLNDYATISFKAALQLAQAYGQREDEANAIKWLAKMGATERSVTQFCILKHAADFYNRADPQNDGVGVIGNLMSQLEGIFGNATPECDTP